MTSWINIALFTESKEQNQKVLRELFDNGYEESLVDDSPPTLMYGHLDNRSDLAQTFLTDMFECVNTVVMVNNSDSGDWATAHVYTEPDDLRDVAEETIDGVSGAKGGDVKAELINRGLSMSISQYYDTLDPKDYIHLWRDA